ncbi:MAG: glycosyltransferase family 2 protein [Nitrospirota bacterium]|nr:glycosyltransferase family 2 protein [Nitrospirota bacterium]
MTRPPSASRSPRRTPRLSVVVPCYNEQEVLPDTAGQLHGLLEELAAAGLCTADSRLWFVDDGSRDATWPMLEELTAAHGNVSAIRLSRNHGHQRALLAGLFTADGDVLISIDADLQDDIKVMAEMLRYYTEGADIVYGVRQSRDADSWFKRWTAQQFYRLMRLMGSDLVYNHADYRLMSRRAVEELKQFGEVNLFLRGIIPALGFTTATVHYDRTERLAGESKYPLRRMIALALNGITSFSVVPLRMITFTGLTIFLLSLFVSAWVIWVRMVSERVVPGWASNLLPIIFLGGIQLLCLGVLGEYLGRIYTEVKRRPRFIIDQVVGTPR